MIIKILHYFVDDASPRPFTQNEILNVPETVASPWIKSGKAIELQVQSGLLAPAPIKAVRERASRFP